MDSNSISFETFSHVSEGVPVNLLLFADQEGDKLWFTHGFVHAPLNAEQSVVLPIHPYLAEVIAPESPGNVNSFDDYFHGIAETLVAQETHCYSASYADPFVSFSAVKNSPVKVVSPLQVYPELKDMLRDTPASQPCYMVECVGNVIQPKQAQELAELPGINTSVVAAYPESTAGWLVWGDPGRDDDVIITVYAGVGLPDRRSDKYFRSTASPSLSGSLRDLVENSGEYGRFVASMRGREGLDIRTDPPAYMCFSGTYKPVALKPRKMGLFFDDMYVLPVFINFDTLSIASTCEIVGAFEALASSEAA